MADTIQRLDDLIEIADNKEVILLAKIVKQLVKDSDKGEVGFKHNNKQEKK